jgi:hypothetical protein
VPVSYERFTVNAPLWLKRFAGSVTLLPAAKRVQEPVGMFSDLDLDSPPVPPPNAKRKISATGGRTEWT